jgi:PHP family Zn ribbon phosphoesterase
MGINTKGVNEDYIKAVQEFGSEFKVLHDVSESDLTSSLGPRIAEGIARMRKGQINISPGYDGEFGQIKLFDDHEEKAPPNIRLTF